MHCIPEVEMLNTTFMSQSATIISPVDRTANAYGTARPVAMVDTTPMTIEEGRISINMEGRGEGH